MRPSSLQTLNDVFQPAPNEEKERGGGRRRKQKTMSEPDRVWRTHAGCVCKRANKRTEGQLTQYAVYAVYAWAVPFDDTTKYSIYAHCELQHMYPALGGDGHACARAGNHTAVYHVVAFHS